MSHEQASGDFKVVSRISVENPRYQEIADAARELARAAFCMLSVYNESSHAFTTVALSGNSEHLTFASAMAGCELGKRTYCSGYPGQGTTGSWRAEYANLEEYAVHGGFMPDTCCSTVQQQLKLGKVIVFGLRQDTSLQGELTFFMPLSVELANPGLVETFAQMVGGMLELLGTTREFKEKEQQLQAIFDHAGVGVCLLTLDSKFLKVNQRYCEITGYSESELLSLCCRDISEPEALKKDQAMGAKALLQQLLRTGKPYMRIKPYVHKQGHIIWVEVSTSLLRGQNGEPDRLIRVSQDITARKKAEEALLKSEKRYRTIIAASNTGAWEYYRNANFMWCGPEYFAMLGYEPSVFPMNGESNLEQVWSDLLHPEDRKLATRRFAEYLAGDLMGMYESYYRMRRKDGGWSWIWSRGQTLRDENGIPSDLTVGTHIDITQQKQTEAALFLEKEQFRTTLLSVADGVISTDNRGRILSLNRVAERLTGWTQETALGRPLQEVFHIVHELTRECHVNPVASVLETGDIIELDNNAVLISRDAMEMCIEHSAAPIYDSDNRIDGVVLVFRDITEKKREQAEIAYLSFHDQLTGLYNRRFFEEELKRLDTPRNMPVSLVMLDVNGLKLVNDAFGHQLGDQVLHRVADIMKRECRSDDIIARIGGDEFVIILPKTDSAEAGLVAKRIHGAMCGEVVEALHVSVSYGWESKQESSQDIISVLKKAEDHMYRHKLSESASMRHKTIELIVKTLYEKSAREEHHSKRVSELSAAIGTALQLSREHVSELRAVGLMHDIGKIAIDDRILNKPTALDDYEGEEIRRHSEIGYQIMSSVNEFAPLAEYVLAHHERWDGTGYPRGISGEQIPLAARIVAVADAYDAMTTARSYPHTMSKEEAAEEILRKAGSQFDPLIAKVFLEKVLGELAQATA
jgi:diguanylate cyclase (GGDEF)-like protein/PAS domain S-box-containing protein